MALMATFQNRYRLAVYRVYLVLYRFIPSYNRGKVFGLAVSLLSIFQMLNLMCVLKLLGIDIGYSGGPLILVLNVLFFGLDGDDRLKKAYPGVNPDNSRAVAAGFFLYGSVSLLVAGIVF